jgi:hypothetical protein
MAAILAISALSLAMRSSGVPRGANSASHDAVLQVLCDDARGQIDAATGRIGHDDPDCLARERLRLRRCGDDRDQSDQPPLHVTDAHDDYSPSASSGPRR